MSICNTFQDLFGTSIGIAGFFCCELLIVWHGTQNLTCLAMSFFMFGQNMLPFVLNVILVTPAWPLWSAFKQWPLNAIGIKNLHSQVMYECSIDKSSLHCQNGLRISGSFLQDSGQPSNVCWISSWSVLSYCVVFWINSTCILDSCVCSWMVTSKPLISVFSFGLTLLSASAIGMSLSGKYLMTKSYGCILSNSLGEASLRCFRCMSLRGLWSLWHMNSLW